MKVAELKGVGPQISKLLLKCGISTFQDLLFHLPYRYQDRTRLTPIRDLQNGHFAVVEGEIIHSQITQGRRPSMLCYLNDGTGILALRFFHFYKEQQNKLIPGTRIRCFGEATSWKKEWEIIHPEIHFINPNSFVEETLTPLYSTTEGLSQYRWRMLTQQALEILKDKSNPFEFLPETILKKI